MRTTATDERLTRERLCVNTLSCNTWIGGDNVNPIPRLGRRDILQREIDIDKSIPRPALTPRNIRDLQRYRRDGQQRNCTEQENLFHLNASFLNPH